LRHWRSSESLFRQAVVVTKDNWLSHYNLAGALSEQVRFDEAATEYRRAIGIHPNYAHAHINLGTLLLRQGRAEEAISHWQKVMEIRPGDAPTHNNLATALLGQGRVDEAIAHLQRALESDPGLVIAHNNLGNALLRKGRLDEAITHFREAVRLRPEFARAHCSLGRALLNKGQVAEALAHYQAAVAVRPANPSVLGAAAWAFATCPEAGVRNGSRAVELAEEAERLAGGANPAALGTLAAAYAEAGRFPEAVAAAQRAQALLSAQGNTPQAQALRAQLALYQTGLPFRDPSLSPHPK
jgi:tetratricopeptide (TPR) repeat protein